MTWVSEMSGIASMGMFRMRPPARHAQTKDTQEHDEPIAGAEVNNALDHTALLGGGR